MAAAPERFLTLYFDWRNIFAESDDTLREYVNGIEDDLKNVVESDCNISSFSYIDQTTEIDGYDAYRVYFNYEHKLVRGDSDYPETVEIKLEKENDNYYINEITENRDAGSETLSIKVTAYFIRNGENLYFVAYGGDAEDYSIDELAEIMDSYQIFD